MENISKASFKSHGGSKRKKNVFLLTDKLCVCDRSMQNHQTICSPNELEGRFTRKLNQPKNHRNKTIGTYHMDWWKSARLEPEIDPEFTIFFSIRLTNVCFFFQKKIINAYMKMTINIRVLTPIQIFANFFSI